ncbi:MAG: peptide deformylase [Oscillospiraceae bacterium]|nr:peptide deformylase [Oscillospiraceae bacterium]
MAIRNIVKEGDEVLRKISKPVTKFDERLWQLLDDMAETMAEANGVGLAAPQVGILRRVVVIDVGEGVIELINPQIISAAGEDVGPEGCLSVPGEWGIVARPEKAAAKAQDRNGKEIVVEGEGLLARALCHEIDHLEGRLFRDIAQRMMSAEEMQEMEQAEQETGEE